MSLKHIPLWFASVCATTLLASEMPPMPPGMMGDSGTQKQSVAKSAGKRQSGGFKLPEACSGIPPMVVLFPPPMQAEVDKCRNAMGKPTVELAQKNLPELLSKELTVKNVESVEGHIELYKITYVSQEGFLFKSETESSLYCNPKLTSCVAGELHLKTEEAPKNDTKSETKG